MKTPLLLLSIISTVTVIFAAKSLPDTLTLADAVRTFIGNSDAYAAAGAAEAAAAAKTDAARSAFRPSAGLTATYANIGPTEKLDFPMVIPPSTTPTIMSFQLYPANNYDIHAGVDYLIWDFGKRDQFVAAAATGADVALKKSFSIKTAVAFQAANLFSLLLIQEHGIAEKQEDSAALERHLEFVKRKLETGSATEFDELRTEVQLSRAKTDLNKLENDLAKNKIEFAELAGIEKSRPIRLRGSFDSVATRIITDSLVTLAMRERVELKLCGDGMKSLAAQKRLVELENAPSLAAKATAGFKNGYISDLNIPKFNWSIGAAFMAPIADGGKARYHRAEIDARIDSLRHAINDLQRKIRIEVLKAAQDVNSAYATLALAGENQRLAREAFRIANLQYEAGTATNLDVLDAQTKYSESKFAYLQCQYACTISRFALQMTTGYDFSLLAEK